MGCVIVIVCHGGNPYLINDKIWKNYYCLSASPFSKFSSGSCFINLFLKSLICSFFLAMIIFMLLYAVVLLNFFSSSCDNIKKKLNLKFVSPPKCNLNFSYFPHKFIIFILKKKFQNFIQNFFTNFPIFFAIFFPNSDILKKLENDFSF